MTASVWRHYWVVVILLAFAVPLPGYFSTNSSVPLRRPFSELSYDVGSWHGRDQHMNDGVRVVLSAQDVLLREYVDTNAPPVSLFVSYFGRQRQGETNHSPQHCLPGAGWQPLQSRRIPYPLAAADTPVINEIVYEKEGRRQLVVYWYRERDRVLASEYMVKWYLIWDAMTRRRTDGALLRVSTPIEVDDQVARQRVLAFMQLILPHLNEFFPN